MKLFFLGFLYLFQGFGLLAKKGVKRYVIVPAIINCLLFVTLFFFLKHYIHLLNTTINHWLPAWLHWLDIFIWVIFFAAFLLFFVYAFVAIGNLVLAPFNSFLSEKIEYLLTGEHTQKNNANLMKEMWRAIARQLTIITYYLLRILCLFILMLIPVIQMIVPLLWFMFSAWFISMTYMDYPTDNHRISVAGMRQWLRQHYLESFGFGCAAFLLSSVPIINFIVMPAAVAGATKFWIEANKNNVENIKISY